MNAKSCGGHGCVQMGSDIDWLVLAGMRAHFMASKIDGTSSFIFRVHYATTVQDYRSFLVAVTGCSVATCKASEDPRVR